MLISACRNDEKKEVNDVVQTEFSNQLDAAIASSSKNKLDSAQYLQFQKDLNSFNDLNHFKYYYLSALLLKGNDDIAKSLYYAKQADSFAVKLKSSPYNDSIFVKNKLLISRKYLALNNKNLHFKMPLMP